MSWKTKKKNKGKAHIWCVLWVTLAAWLDFTLHQHIKRLYGDFPAGGGRPQVPLYVLFHALAVTRVEPPTFCKLAG